MTKKNVLIFGHGYATQFIDINNQYTRLFDKTNTEVTVVYLIGAADEAIRAKHSADQVIFLNSPLASVRGLKIQAIKAMIALCKKKKFEMVICHRYKPIYIMLWVARFCRIPRLVGVMHELGTLKSWTRRLTLALLAPSYFMLAGVSNAVRDDLRQYAIGISDSRIITLYNSLTLEQTESHLHSKETARQILSLPADAFVFGTIGRLVKNKDQKTLIMAFHQIADACPDACLIILGDGVLENELKTLVQSLGLQSRVYLMGFIPEASHLLRAFDVFISTSIQEAFGMVLIEAMAAKVPVIATRVNGIPEVVGPAGTLIEPGDIQELADHLLKMYHENTVVRAQWGEQGYARVVENFSLQAFRKNFYENCLCNHL